MIQLLSGKIVSREKAYAVEHSFDFSRVVDGSCSVALLLQEAIIHGRYIEIIAKSPRCHSVVDVALCGIKLLFGQIVGLSRERC